jgi:SET domain-containing protein
MASFGFFVKYDLKDAEFKYGFKQLGLFAAENLKKGQPIFRCNPSTCVYLTYEEIDKALTREEVLELCKKCPESEDFIHRYSYMPDDDAFDFPKTYKEQNLTENCMFFNHSCDGNCGFASEDCGLVIAKRDIEIGEELCYDYQLMDVEPTFYDGLNCRCGSHKCRGVLRFSHYRNVDWSIENYKYAGNLVQKRIDELKTKWFSSSCYIKKYNNKTELGLTALKKIAKNELVAVFSDLKNVSQSAHYFRHSDSPSCYVTEEGEVYAKADIEPLTELTIKF